LIPNVSSDAQKSFVDIVKKILEKKKCDHSFCSSPLEAEINRMVYELYGLTDEEIKTVEGV